MGVWLTQRGTVRQFRFLVSLSRPWLRWKVKASQCYCKMAVTPSSAVLHLQHTRRTMDVLLLLP
jgi:hypothetical protein